MRTPPSRVEDIINHRVRGCGLRTTAELCHVSRETVTAWSLRIGEACARLLDARLRNLTAHHIQADELHTTVGAKQRHLDANSPAEYGDCWGFVAEDAFSRAVISYRLGNRDSATTFAFAADLRARVSGRPHVTTDAFRSYLPVFRQVFGDDVDYMQLVKRYAGTKLPNGHKMWTLKSADFEPKIGAPSPSLSSTSYVERLFATLRGRLSKYGRKSAEFSKSRRNLAADLALFVATYNFIHVHSSLKRTPAQALGIADRAWRLGELIDAALSEPEPEPLQILEPSKTVQRVTRRTPAPAVATIQDSDAMADADQLETPQAPPDHYRRDRALLIKVSKAAIDAWHQSAKSSGSTIADWVEHHLDAAVSSGLADANVPIERRARVRRPPPLAVFALWFPSAPVSAWRAAADAAHMTLTSWVQHHLDAAVTVVPSAVSEVLASAVPSAISLGAHALPAPVAALAVGRRDAKVPAADPVVLDCLQVAGTRG